MVPCGGQRGTWEYMGVLVCLSKNLSPKNMALTGRDGSAGKGQEQKIRTNEGVISNSSGGKCKIIYFDWGRKQQVKWNREKCGENFEF